MIVYQMAYDLEDAWRRITRARYKVCRCTLAGIVLPSCPTCRGDGFTLNKDWKVGIADGLGGLDLKRAQLLKRANPQIKMFKLNIEQCPENL